MYKIEKNKNGKYAVKKIGAQRATKVFDKYEEALKYCAEKNQNLKPRKKSKFILFIILLILLFIVYYFIKPYIKGINNNSSSSSSNQVMEVDGDISIHFLELGNYHTGDSVYIKAGETDILIDAGSIKSSASAIKTYIDNYCLDGKLEYVIATHKHEDHIAGFLGTTTIPGIFESYQIETLIDFPKVVETNKLYEEYLDEVARLVEGGTKHYNALDCYNNENGGSRKYELTEGIELEILYNYYYDHSTTNENNNSVCLIINHGYNHYLFTGDLESDGEEKLVDYNNLPRCKLYKAGHHGSGTSSSEKLLSAISPEIICVCCCAGNDEYSDNKLKQFPSQEFIDRVAKYTDKIYVTTLGDLELLPEGSKYASMNGNIVVSSQKEGNLVVSCSNNNIILKETQWFKNNRTWPSI